MNDTEQYHTGRAAAYATAVGMVNSLLRSIVNRERARAEILAVREELYGLRMDAEKKADALLEAPAQTKPAPSWKESGFSGNQFRMFDMDAGAKWSLSFNRYGAPRATLYMMSPSGGGIPILSKKLDVLDTDTEDRVVALALEWAEASIQDGSANLAFMFGPKSRVDFDGLPTVEMFKELSHEERLLLRDRLNDVIDNTVILAAEEKV